MKKNRFLRYHVVGWLGFFIYRLIGVYFFPSSVEQQHFSASSIIFLVSYQLSLMGVFYYCYLLILPGFEKRDQRPFYILGALLIPVLFVILRYVLEQVIDPLLFGVSNYPSDIPLSFYLFDNIYYGAPVVFLSLTAWSLEGRSRKEQQIKQLKQENTIAELDFLRSQVNPHFLYNTLNYIYAQAIPVSDKLADAIIKLSKMMRYILHESTPNAVEIQSEIDYLDNYIALYRLRFKGIFFVEFCKEIREESQQVAPLMMIPFVENAFKHGVVNDPDHPINIEMHTDEKLLHFTVTNEINRDQKDESSGIGLNNVRRRLELLYPNRHKLVILNDGTQYQTFLTIEL